MKDKLPDFAGKVVSLSFVAADDTNAIEDPHWESQGGRLFLVGTIPGGGSTRNWVEGVRCAVAWDMVSDYMVFDSAEEYVRRLGIYERRKRNA